MNMMVKKLGDQNECGNDTYMDSWDRLNMKNMALDMNNSNRNSMMDMEWTMIGI